MCIIIGKKSLTLEAPTLDKTRAGYSTVTHTAVNAGSVTWLPSTDS